MERLISGPEDHRVREYRNGSLGTARILGLAALLGIVIFALSAAAWNPSGAHASSCAEGVTFDGTALEGTDCADVILAPPGIETIESGAGDDVILATEGVLGISAGSGDDLIIGTEDLIVISAGSGDDTIYGEVAPAGLQTDSGASVSRLERRLKKAVRGIRVGQSYGNQNCNPNNDSDCCREIWEAAGIPDDHLTGGNDSCTGGDGDQIIYAENGNDFVWGGRGNDQLFGQNGEDRLFGSVGDDYINGGNDDDWLAGNNGSDNILGESGNDLVHGDTVGDERQYNNDEPAGLSGGPDNDTLSFATAVPPGFQMNLSPYLSSQPNLTSEVSGFPAYDEDGDVRRGVYVDLSKSIRSGLFIADNGVNKNGGGKDEILDDFENIVGSPFADVIIGDADPNKIFGGGGADVLIGMDGADTIWGGQDGDYLDGNLNTATGYNDSDQDKLYGGGPTVVNPATASFDVDQCATSGVSELTNDGCELDSRTPRRVQSPDPNKINIGMMALPSEGLRAGMSPYVTGSIGNDKVKVLYEADFNWSNGSKGAVLFTNESETRVFNTATVIGSGCSVPANQTVTVRCPFAPPSMDNPNNFAPTLTMAGEKGYDNLDVRKLNSSGNEVTNLPITTTVVVNGGQINDKVYGSSTTEDILIDGPGDDEVWGYGSTDVLYATEGQDEIRGGAAGDVLYATGTCENNQLIGGDGVDNITWAAWNPQFEDKLENWAETPGIDARLTVDTNGLHKGTVVERHAAPLGTGCLATEGATTVSNSAGYVDDIVDVENLEGTGGKDTLIGDREDNTLLGRGGVDGLYGGAGSDILKSHSNDYDAKIDCGGATAPGAPDDIVARDFQRGDDMDATPGTVEHCPDVVYTGKYSNTGLPYLGWPIEYDRSADVTISTDPEFIQAENLTVGDIKAHFRLGEQAGDRAFESRSKPGGGKILALSGKYVGEGSDVRSTANTPIPDTADNAHSFDGSNDELVLDNPGTWYTSTPTTLYDPATYKTSGYVVEMFAKFTDGPAGTYEAGKAQFLFSKTDGTNGVSLYRKTDSTDANPATTAAAELVLRVERDANPANDLILSRSALTDGAWHHYAFQLLDFPAQNVGLLATYVDGVTAASIVSGSAFPAQTNTEPARIGKSGFGTEYLPADVDNLLIIGKSVPSCQILRQLDLRESPIEVTGC